MKPGTTGLTFMIVGSSRSGTTLVQRLACELDDVRMPPETHFFSRFAPDLAARAPFPLGPAGLKKEVAAYQRAYEAWTGNELGLDERQVEEELGGRCASAVTLFAAIVACLAGNASILGEKTPEHLLWWRPLSKVVPRLKFVIVVRDPRGVVSSILNTPWRRKTHGALAERWRIDQRESLAAKRELGMERCLLLRYEDVVRQPQDASDALASFIGTGAACRVGSAPTSAMDVVLPWETWKARALESVTDERVDAWHSELSRTQILDISAVCYSGMKSFGYDPSTDRMHAMWRRLSLPSKQQMGRLAVRSEVRSEMGTIGRITL